MENILAVTIKKQITKIAFDKDQYELAFAEEFCKNGYKVKEAYDTAYFQINKVRASNLVGCPHVWNLIFTKIIAKKKTTQKEKDWIKEFNRIKENYSFNPFELYLLYVDINPETGIPISSSISSDPIKDFVILINLHNFFDLICREKFLSEVKIRIKEDYKLFQQDETQLQELTKQLKYLYKKQDVEYEDIIKSCMKFKKGDSPFQLKMDL